MPPSLPVDFSKKKFNNTDCILNASLYGKMDGHTIITTLSPDYGRFGQGTQTCEASAKISPKFLQPSLSSSLDNISTNLDKKPFVSSWSKKQKRAFSCAVSGLRRCEYMKKHAFFLTLTSAPNTSGLARAWDLLVKRVRRELNYAFEYMKVETSEGNGVLHVLFHSAFDGWDYDAIHAYFSCLWQELHASPIVWCTHVDFSKSRRISAYFAQYQSSQAGFLRRSCSLNWIFPRWRSLLLGFIRSLGFSSALSKFNLYLHFYSSPISFSQSNFSSSHLS